MATYISLVSFTDQGIRNVKDTVDRFAKFETMAKNLGVTIKSAHWTVGN
jgi:uncharacterized protein with GYD domain